MSRASPRDHLRLRPLQDHPLRSVHPCLEVDIADFLFFFTGFRGWCTTFLGLGWKVSETQVEVKTWMSRKPNKHKQSVLAPPGRAYATFPCPHGVDSQPLGAMHPGSFEDCLYAWCLRLPWTCRKRWGPVEILKHPLNSPLAIST